MSIGYRVLYLLIALVPTHMVGTLVLFGKNQRFLGVLFLVLAVLGFVFSIIFVGMLFRRHSGRTIEIVDYQNSDSNLMSFLISFVPFFLDFEFSNVYFILAFCIFYSTFIIVMTLTDGLMPSPILYIFQWRILDTWIKDKGVTSNCVILVKRKYRISKGSRELVQIGDGRVFIDAKT